MKAKLSFVLLFLHFCVLINKTDGFVGVDPDLLSRSNFPDSFIFGTASSSYQYEGAANDGGRGPSIWDTFTRDFPNMIKDHSNGSLAIDSYNRYKEDVGIMTDLGFDAYRFSISWSRLLPHGKLSGGVNQEGITYYNNLINELISNGMKPFVTLFHWDLPQALEDDYGGFRSPLIVVDFKDYAELCYKSFGDRVKHWITLNEPMAFSNAGYALGTFAPGRCSKWTPDANCTAGDSSVEPYIVTHNQLLAHAAAVQIYRDKYKVAQQGQIGITLNSVWFEPLRDTYEDLAAANRAIAFMYGWFMEPLNSGTYPTEMIDYVQTRLPKFSTDESLMIKGSFDFIGLNYYAANYATNVPCITRQNYLSYSTDSCLNITDERDGVPIGSKAASEWLSIYPEGILNLLLYTKEKFNNPVIYITENGVDEVNNGVVSLEDNVRVNYHKNHLSFAQIAMNEYGVDLRGYFAWSLLDNFEWTDGYTVRFGLCFVDFEDGFKRYPKSSANWFKMFLRGGNQTKAYSSN